MRSFNAEMYHCSPRRDKKRSTNFNGIADRDAKVPAVKEHRTLLTSIKVH